MTPGRLVTGLVTTLALVQQPGSAVVVQRGDARSAEVGRPVGRHQGDGPAFVVSLGGSEHDRAAVDRRARWLVRMLTSLLLFPGQGR